MKFQIWNFIFCLYTIGSSTKVCRQFSTTIQNVFSFFNQNFSGANSSVARTYLLLGLFVSCKRTDTSKPKITWIVTLTTNQICYESNNFPKEP